MECAIEICDLKVEFNARGRPVTALDGLNLRVNCGQVVGFLSHI